jgi:3-deoxy-D-manno-octulosonate 8-phosphate phosphatase (KDO 8-P phosphatase)
LNDSEIQQRAAKIKLLLMDCDGVMTDGRLWMLAAGDDHKAFYARDGLGIELFHRAGLQTGVISGRNSSALDRRARGLKMRFIWQGSENKRQAFHQSLKEAALSSDEIAFIGDDLSDIPLMKLSGLAVAVNDAAEETKAAAHYITRAPGGRGAVREVCELILKSQGKWAPIIDTYHE